MPAELPQLRSSSRQRPAQRPLPPDRHPALPLPKQSALDICPTPLAGQHPAGCLCSEPPFCGCFLPFSLGLLQELRVDMRQPCHPLTPRQLLMIFTLYRTETSSE